MNRSISVIAISFLLFGCLSLKKQSFENGKFVEYRNGNKVGIRMDNERYFDREISLEIPKSEYQTGQLIRSAFIQVITFGKSQAIVTLYDPISGKFDSSSKEKDSLLRQSISYNEFTEFLEAEKLDWQLNDILKYRKNRKFGIRKIKDIRFYAFYINSTDENVATFNYSLNSIKVLDTIRP